MPDPTPQVAVPQSFLQRLIQAAQKVPGLRPATVNGQPETETDARLMNASKGAGQSIRQAIGPERADQIAAAVQNLREQVGQKWQDHYAPISLDPASYKASDIPVIGPPTQAYINAHRPAPEPVIELDDIEVAPLKKKPEEK